MTNTRYTVRLTSGIPHADGTPMPDKVLTCDTFAEALIQLGVMLATCPVSFVPATTANGPANTVTYVDLVDPDTNECFGTASITPEEPHQP